jgi:Na+/H+ antiporter NhaD/arsenite permease-like protein
VDPNTLELLTGIVFILTYALIVLFYKKKALVIWGGVALVLLLGALSFSQAWASINWNVIGIYVGMLFVAEALIRSRMPDYLAIWFTNKSKKVWVAMLAVCTLTGLLSIVLENVACVLITAPIIFAIAKRIRVSPVPMIIGGAIASNLEGVATLIGDPPSMLLAAHANMDFNDFFFFNGAPSLFFAVQLGLIAGLAVLFFFFRKYEHPVQSFREITIKSMFPTAMLIAMIGSLAASSLKKDGATHMPLGAICLMFGFACLVWMIMDAKRENKRLFRTIQDMDWGTALFIIAVFILVESLTKTGIVADLAQFIYGFTGTSVLFTYLVIVVLSMLLSGFVDNVPFIVAMLPVTEIIAQHGNISPYVLYFGLLVGTSVGGNITPVGASANIVGVGLLKNRGYETSFWDFMKMGLPFTLASVIVSAGFIWIMYGV